MMNVKKPRRPLSLQTETLRRLTTLELSDVVGGMAPKTLPCSIPCTTICSGGL
jgi:hypothetical protein